MSHFSVLVIGDDIEKQLQPYHEFECTGENDQYVQDVDVTDECREHGLDYYGLEDRTVTDEAQVDRNGGHRFGFAVVDADGNIIKAVNRTNPNRKWDWWVIGGRWSGFLKLKEGGDGALGRPGVFGTCASNEPGRADQTKKGDIDLEGMRTDAGNSAAERWDTAAKALNGQSFLTWEQVREKHPGDIDAARTEYNGQPGIVALRDVTKDRLFPDFDQYLTPRDQYIQQARDQSTVPYAIVKDGQWIAKGEMGWFGMSDDTEDQASWNRKVNEMLDSLPDDTMITVVDCHI